MFDFLIVYDILRMFLGLYLILEVLMSVDFKKFMSTSKYFSGSAENEETFIKNVFCPQRSIRKLVSIDSSAPKILVGQKGTGKSAFLKFYKNILEENGFPVIFIRPSDIEYKFSQDNSLGGLTRYAKELLVGAIGCKLAENKSVCLTQHDNVLHHLAQKSGNYEPNVVSRISSILSEIARPLLNVDFSKIASALTTHSTSLPIIETAIKESLIADEKICFIFIDDTDKFIPPALTDLNKLWAFVQALSELLEQNKHLRAIISFRSEVWRRLLTSQDGQRDQIDHYRPFVYELKLSEDELSEIIERRLDFAAKQLSDNSTYYYEKTFFNNNSFLTLPNDDEEVRHIKEFISRRSRQRPRNAMQMIGNWFEYCIDNELNYIDSNVVSNCMNKYAKNCVDDLVVEVEGECPQIRTIIDFFAKNPSKEDKGAYTYSSNEMLELVKKCHGYGVRLFSKTLHLQQRDGACRFIDYLFAIGFITAKVADATKPKGYRHIGSQENPQLLNNGSWIEIGKYSWQINPAFYDYLFPLYQTSKGIW